MATNTKKNKETIEIILEHLDRLENKVNQLIERVDKLYELADIEELEGRLTRGGKFITVEISKREVLKLLKREGRPLSAAEVSEKLNISRSYSSSLLNELFRDKKVNKIRVRKVIKFEAA